MNGLLISSILLSIFTAAFMFCAAVIIVTRVSTQRMEIRNRVSKFTEKPKSARYVFKSRSKLKEASPFTNMKLLDVIANELLLANMMIKPEEFLIIWLILIFIPAGLVILFSNELIPAVTLIGMGALLPPIYIKKQQKKRTMKFESQLSDALMVICNCIRSGLTFQQALETSAEQMDAPISQEFARVMREVRYGNNLEKALNNMVKRVGSVDLMLAVSAVNIQRQTGGNLSVILENIASTIKERQKVKDDIRVLTSTGRISGGVIGMLPVGMFLILLLINPDYIKLFFETQLGIILLFVAGIMELIGFLVVKKIVTVKY